MMKMMKPRAVDEYDFTPHDRLFLDANIWLYLYGPENPQASRWVNVYSMAFGRMLEAKSQIFVDVLVVSEFVNVCIRDKRRLFRRSLGNFKRFRKSRHFRPIVQGIAADVKRILKHCSPIESSFATLEIDDLLDEYARGNSDFNDQVITELCKTNGLTLITNDSDFRSQEIPILTANKSLLSPLL